MRYPVFLAVFVLLVGLVHYYLWMRLVRDTAIPHPWSIAGGALISFLAVSLFASALAIRGPRAVAVPILWVGYTWLGLVFFLLLTVASADLLKLGVRAYEAIRAVPVDEERRLAIGRIFAAGSVVAGVGAGGAGMASALSRVEVKKVKVELAALSRGAAPVRIVQISDVHIGPTIGREFIADLVARINALEPDVVAITGDLVDGSVEDLAEHAAPLGAIKAKHGVFFVTGNHEYYSGADDWIAHLTKLGVRVLRNEHVQLPCGVDVAGVDDWSAKQFGGDHGPDIERATRGRDPSRPMVLLAHQPRAIVGAAAHGIALQLSGHTHGGQIFPFNFLVRLQQPYIAGLYDHEKTKLYVSRGTGYWGPPMRLGAPAEITEIELVGASG